MFKKMCVKVPAVVAVATLILNSTDDRLIDISQPLHPHISHVRSSVYQTCVKEQQQNLKYIKMRLMDCTKILSVACMSACPSSWKRSDICSVKVKSEHTTHFLG